MINQSAVFKIVFYNRRKRYGTAKTNFLRIIKNLHASGGGDKLIMKFGRRSYFCF